MKTLKKCLLAMVILLNSQFAVAQVQDKNRIKIKLNEALQANRLDLATGFAEALLNKADSPDDYLLGASVFELKGEQKKSDPLYLKALEFKNGEQFKVYHDLGYVYLRRSDHGKAKSYMLNSLQMNAAQPELNHVLSAIYQVDKKPDSALIYGLKAYQQIPTNPDYIKQLANYYLRAGNLEEAIVYLEKLSGKEKGNDSAKLALAGLYLKTDDFAKALPLYQSLSQDSLDRHDFLYGLATCYLETEQPYDAAQTISKAIAMTGNPQKSYYDLLIQSYAATGEHHKVIQTYQNGLEKGISSYGNWLTEYNTAVNEVKNELITLDQSPGLIQKASLVKLSAIYLAAKDYGSAIKVINEYKKLGGMDNDSTKIVAASAYLGLQRYSEAKEALTGTDKTFSAENAGLFVAILYKLKDYQSLIGILEGPNKEETTLDQDLRDDLLFRSYSKLGDQKKASKYLHLSN
ncbi:tetratricopeptide repeat protein [Pedobacter steynii]|uniref:tetratricopeptide repeat protein n=1 Tax=Pedobacter steynii TaxID=430522 RepID=UPI000942FE6B|nr:tetratricopeptide repeat protein [Pedobacter steynii]NQX40661.1 tetratricopeptide repeat protein [Pedobacter steynii]